MVNLCAVLDLLFTALQRWNRSVKSQRIYGHHCLMNMTKGKAHARHSTEVTGKLQDVEQEELCIFVSDRNISWPAFNTNSFIQKHKLASIILQTQF